MEVLIVVEAATSLQPQRDRVQETHQLSALGEATKRAVGILGDNCIERFNLPHNRHYSPGRLDIIKESELRIARHQSQVVYLHHAWDLNVDHHRLHEAVVTACQTTSGSGSVLQPNRFVDISNQWLRKREALVNLVSHASEMRPWPHARTLEALEHLTRWHGAQVWVKAVEAFCLLRQLM